ncbi:MAG: hypothetical protein ACPMAQ_07245 [Phycisphaerae bacterium]
MPALLAVDLGLRTGLALYGRDGRLVWYRSQHFGTLRALRRGVRGVLDALPELGGLVLEGGGPPAAIWEQEAGRRGLSVRRISAEQWRQLFLYPREQRTGPQAKRHAGEMARRVIVWSGARRPTSLRHDTAEAILLGLWRVIELGWLDALPRELQGR